TATNPSASCPAVSYPARCNASRSGPARYSSWSSADLPRNCSSSWSLCRMAPTHSAPLLVKTPNFVDVEPGLITNTRLLSFRMVTPKPERVYAVPLPHHHPPGLRRLECEA